MFWGLAVVGYMVWAEVACSCNYMPPCSQHVCNHSVVKTSHLFLQCSTHFKTSWWHKLMKFLQFCIRMLLHQKKLLLRILIKTTIFSTKQSTFFFEPIDSNHIMMQRVRFCQQYTNYAGINNLPGCKADLQSLHNEACCIAIRVGEKLYNFSQNDSNNLLVTDLSVDQLTETQAWVLFC